MVQSRRDDRELQFWARKTGIDKKNCPKNPADIFLFLNRYKSDCITLSVQARSAEYRQSIPASIRH
jgi:hypothetical protein